MRLHIVDPTQDPSWRKLVTDSPTDVFSSPEWIGAIKNTYGFDVKAAVIVDDDSTRPVAGLAYADITDLRGRRIVGLPFSDYSDGLVQTQGEWQILQSHLLGYGYPISLRCLHNEFPHHDRCFEVSGLWSHHVIDLSGGADAIWAGVAGSARRAVRRAERGGVHAEPVTTLEGLRDFFVLHLRRRKFKHRLLAQPYRFFEAIWNAFLENGNGILIGAYKEGVMLAGVLLLKWGDTSYYKYNASEPTQLNLRPNDLLMWAAIRWGLASGSSKLDLGLSDLDQEGLVRYKRKWATEEQRLRSYQSSGFELDSAQKLTPLLLDQLSSLFTQARVPDHVTERAGETMYRYFA